MAPLTRNRAAQPGNVPQELNATYYAQRATAGFILSEATQVSQQGQGYPGTPGIHSSEQVMGWQNVTKAVHDKGGKIFLQLWHVGRISHSSHQPDGKLLVAPSAIPAKNSGTYTADWQPTEILTPRALEVSEIKVDHRKIVLEMDLLDKSRLEEAKSLNSSMALMKNRDPNALDANDQIELVRRQLVLTEMGIEIPRTSNGEIDVKALFLVKINKKVDENEVKNWSPLKTEKPNSSLITEIKPIFPLKN